VTAIGSLDYTWDWRNRLASAERSGGVVTSYGYDHTGQRVFQATGSATTSYPNRYYNVASSSLTATTTKHIFSPDGSLLATVVVGSGAANASTTYLHPDHLGGTNVTTDEDGEVTQTLDYYPFGSQRLASGSVPEQRRFIGEEYDSDTEFSYLNARYYQGSRGQFMSQDPVFLLMGDRRLERAFGLFKLAAFVEVAQFLELGEQTCAHVTARGFRILQQHTRELLVDAEEFARVFFEKEFRMKHRPVMGGADEGEQAQQVLVAIAAQSLIQGASGAL
jgi:RHS repeat-associated protein